MEDGGRGNVWTPISATILKAAIFIGVWDCTEEAVDDGDDQLFLLLSSISSSSL